MRTPTPAGARTRPQRNPLTGNSESACLGQDFTHPRHRKSPGSRGGKHRGERFLYHRIITFSGSRVRYPTELKALCKAFHLPAASRRQAIVALVFAGGERFVIGDLPWRPRPGRQTTLRRHPRARPPLRWAAGKEIDPRSGRERNHGFRIQKQRTEPRDRAVARTLTPSQRLMGTAVTTWVDSLHLPSWLASCSWG